MSAKTPASSLPTEIKTERLILRSTDLKNDTDCANINYVRCNPPGGPGHVVKYGEEAARMLRYKNNAHGPREELCTLTTAPESIFWLLWLPSRDKQDEIAKDLTNLVGIVGMNFRAEMPSPDMGYVVTAAHGGHGYASEAGQALLHYWRDLVGVRDIYVACPVDNKPSRRCAERMGFVYGGTMVCEEGRPPDSKYTEAIAYVLPGSGWKDGQVIRPALGWPPEDE